MSIPTYELLLSYLIEFDLIVFMLFHEIWLWVMADNIPRLPPPASLLRVCAWCLCTMWVRVRVPMWQMHVRISSKRDSEREKKNHSNKLRTAGNPEWNKNSTLKTFPMLFCCSCRSCFQLHTIFRRVLVCRIRCLFEGGLDPKNSEKIQIPKSFPLSLWWVFVCANAFFNQFQCYFANA